MEASVVDITGLSEEQFEDFAGGMTVAINQLKKMHIDAVNILIRNKASSYDDYLLKFHKVQVIDMLIGDLQHLKDKRKET
jgi:hypothetical protein